MVFGAIDELIGAALSHMRASSGSHSFETKVEKDLPLVHVDGLLIEQVLVNLIQNAADARTRRWMGHSMG